MSLIYVAGSGPSVKGFDFAHVSTKKMKVDCDHVVLPRANWINPRNRMKAIVWSSQEMGKVLLRVQASKMEAIQRLTGGIRGD